jgi:hypothetical protein
MNDIQTEVNFFEWFDKYYKSKILNDRTTKNLLQKEDKATHKTIIIKAKPSTINTKSIIPNTRPMTTNNSNQQRVADNIHFAKKQTPLASQYGTSLNLY